MVKLFNIGLQLEIILLWNNLHMDHFIVWFVKCKKSISWKNVTNVYPTF